MKFKDLTKRKHIFLYAGDIPKNIHYLNLNLVGLSIEQEGFRTIMHDITNKMDLPDCSVDTYQAEDVLEHIEYDKLVDVLNEVYRVLKVGGYFRISIPDYRCDILNKRSIKNENGEIIFDPEGGGDYVDGKVVGGGHVWFPTYEKIADLINKSDFNKVCFYHYYDENNISVTKKIDYRKGYVQRTPDHDNRVKKPYRCMSIVVDLVK